jgi:hypothetical protein
MRGAIGVIFGETNTREFRFVISNPDVKKGDYVKVWHDQDGWVLSQIISITRTSEISSPDVAMELVEGRSSGSEDIMVAKATIIGVRDSEGLLRAPRTPFSPGDRVFLANESLIQETLGLKSGDAYIGLLDGHDVRVYLDINQLVQKHVSILARTGSGKSYTTGVIIEELLERNVPLVIIDPHGEYASMKYPNSNPDEIEKMVKYGISPKGYADKIVVYTPANFAINPNADRVFRIDGINLHPREIVEMIPGRMSSAQEELLYEIVTKLRNEVDSYDIHDIIRAVEKSKNKARWGLITHLEALRDSGIISSEPVSIRELVRRGIASIIDMTGVSPEMQKVIVAYLCREIFESRKRNRVPPAMIVMEEAHNFCPERGYDRAPSTEIIRTIASEGRKFGLGLLVVSQRPARVDKNILSQCNTQIILKVTNPNDIRAISKGLEGMSSELEEEIKRLPPGVALLVSTYIERPIFVDIRVRRSQHGGESPSVIHRGRSERNDGILEKIFRRRK